MDTEEEERAEELAKKFRLILDKSRSAESSPANLETATEDLPSTPVSTPEMKWWWIELWYEKRELFKEFMAEVGFVGLFLLSFEVFHHALGMTTLEPQQILLLNKTHFYLNYGSLVILGPWALSSQF